MSRLHNGDNRRHGHTAGGQTSPEYTAWVHLIARCTNPKHPKYPDYGGRGITVCPEWRASFSAFLADMGERPSPDHSIDRIDNDKGYTRWNCKYATRVEQRRNRRDSQFVVVGGERLCLVDVADRAGVKLGTLRFRLSKGLTLQKALSMPVKRRRPARTYPTVEWNGVLMPLAKAARVAGLSPETVRKRVELGWTPERALSTPVWGSRSTPTTSDRSASR